MLTIYDLSREQLDELKSNWFWSEEFPGCIGSDGLPVLFPGDIPDSVMIKEFCGICFYSDDFSCTAGHE